MQVTITSYRMVALLRTQLAARSWGLLLVDESHALCTTTRAADAQHTEAVCACAKAARHVILLSGTPSLRRPFQLWRQVRLLRPSLLASDKWAYGKDYCAQVHRQGWFAPLGGGLRDWELHLLLRSSLMIRRLKRDVMTELPAKRRQWLRLRLSVADLDSSDTARVDGDAAVSGSPGATGNHHQSSGEEVGAAELAREETKAAEGECLSHRSASGAKMEGRGSKKRRLRGSGTFPTEGVAEEATLSTVAGEASCAEVSGGETRLVTLPEPGSAEVPLVAPPDLRSLVPLGGVSARGTADDAADLRTHFQTAYEAAGLAKLPQACAWIQRTLSAQMEACDTAHDASHDGTGHRADAEEGVAGGRTKLVIFAHHRRVMDGIGCMLHREGVPFVRMDGSTPHSERHRAVLRFRQVPIQQEPYGSLTYKRARA